MKIEAKPTILISEMYDFVRPGRSILTQPLRKFRQVVGTTVDLRRTGNRLRRHIEY